MNNFNLEYVSDLIKNKPDNHELVVLINGTMYVVVTVEKDTLYCWPMKRLDILDVPLEIEEPNITNHWYFPKKDGKFFLKGDDDGRSDSGGEYDRNYQNVSHYSGDEGTEDFS
jgi:hypothetical protein